MQPHQDSGERAADSLPQRSRDETARLGDTIYERTVRAHVEPEHDGDVVAIDVDSGAYAVADDALTAARRLRDQYPHADVWLRRVGSRTLDRIGAGAGSGDR
jgi:hypothetical protein